MTSRRILISANSAWYLANFRSPIISAMVEAGYEVVAAANPDPAVAELEAIGCRFEPIRIDSKGLSPLRDAATFLSYLRLMRRVRPDVFVGSTIKPNIYGGMAAAILGIPAVNDISGLGTAFIRKSWVTAVAERLYRLGLARAHAVFFQNIHDRALFLERGLVRPEQARLIPGSGVNLDRFAPAGVPAGRAEGTTFLLIGRLLADKGVFEYVEAARSLKRERPDLRFLLLGFLGAENRTAVSETALRSWVEEGTVEYLGSTGDVRPHVAAADCIVLPSYREGTSRVLLEAAAMAKPIVATDVPGCNNVVEPEATGFLCAPRSAESLIEALRRMAELPPEQRLAMGRAGREKMRREFDVSIVVGRFLEAVSDALRERAR